MNKQQHTSKGHRKIIIITIVKQQLKQATTLTNNKQHTRIQQATHKLTTSNNTSKQPHSKQPHSKQQHSKQQQPNNNTNKNSKEDYG